MDFNELKEVVKINKKTDEEVMRIRKEQEERENKKRELDEILRKKAYFNSLPERFREASFENFIGLEKERKKVEKLTGGVLYGTNGNGKTHLGYAACRKVVENGGTAKLIKAFDFFNEIKKEFSKPDSVGTVIKKYSELDYLVIDECDKIFGSQTEYLSLIDLIGKRYDKRKPTLVISNCKTLKELSNIISISCVDKLRDGENIPMVYDKEDKSSFIYKSKRGKDEQNKLKNSM